MIIVNCAQGSPEWHEARAGVITASMFGDARAKLKSGPNKGEPTAKALDYAFKLAVERISGKPLDGGFETWQMKRGHELEPEARMEHEIQTGLIVTQVGLVKTDDGAFGASADGFIGDDGGSEYKCFLAPEKLRSFHIDNDASEIMDQVQGCMWITGRKWWHIGMYCPELRPVGRQLWWEEFKRDENYIEKLEEDLWQFKLLVDSYEQKLRSKSSMISLELSSIQHNRVESARPAQAMAEYEGREGKITYGECFTGKPVPPKRRDWVDPETVLKRKPRPMSLAERRRLRQMAEAI